MNVVLELDILFIEGRADYFAGSIWFASEMKALIDDCEQFISFPPGHIYSSKQGKNNATCYFF